MTDRNKFEEMLERLINEDKAGAEELFHEIVVEKSRDIYESLLEADEEVEETEDEEVDEASDEEVDEASDEEVDEADDEEVDESDEELEEDFDLDEFEVEGDDEPEMPGMDATDDMMGDIEGGDEAEGGEEGVEDAMDDLQAALEKLQQEFDAMTGGEGDDDMGDMDDDEGEEEPEEEAFQFESEDEDEDEDEEVDEASDEEVDESKMTPAELMREFTNKVSATMGDNGDNTKSTLAKPNNMGGTSANIAKGGESTTGGTQGGLLNPNATVDDMGNRNKVGGMSAKQGTKNEPGHGAEKKSSGDNGDKGAQSLTNGVKSRAK